MQHFKRKKNENIKTTKNTNTKLERYICQNATS